MGDYEIRNLRRRVRELEEASCSSSNTVYVEVPSGEDTGRIDELEKTLSRLNKSAGLYHSDLSELREDISICFELLGVTKEMVDKLKREKEAKRSKAIAQAEEDILANKNGEMDELKDYIKRG